MRGHVRTIAALAILPLFGVVDASYAGLAAGVVKSVNVNSQWAGLMVQLDNALSANFESQCPFSNWAYLSIDDPFYKSILATLLAAKASGEPIVVYTSGCTTAPYGSVPRIAGVDYGLRNGS